MGTTETTNTTPLPQMGPAEMSGLARRLQARADSVLLRDQPEQQNDMRAAARLIDRLVHVLAEIRRAADSTEDESTERPLRENAGRRLMSSYLRTDRGDLRLTLFNGDDVLDTQMAATPAEAARVAVRMIASFDELNHGDTVTCRRADEGECATVLQGPGGER